MLHNIHFYCKPTVSSLFTLLYCSTIASLYCISFGDELNVRSKVEKWILPSILSMVPSVNSILLPVLLQKATNFPESLSKLFRWEVFYALKTDLQ